MGVSRLPFAGDTRLNCIYVPGKPEPLLMAGSPTERLQKLCHLNLIEWCAAKQDDRLTPPKAPVVEEKFSRQMASLWPESREAGHDGPLIVATPVDCTADLPVSKHAWAVMPPMQAGEPQSIAMRGPPLPYERSLFEGHWGAFGALPPFDGRGPPVFDMRAPSSYVRPPFDEHVRPPPFDGTGPHTYDLARPPCDGPPHFESMPLGWPGGPGFEGPTMGFERPRFDSSGRPFDRP